jgi:Domain of unknown function (DUF4328)
MSAVAEGNVWSIHPTTTLGRWLRRLLVVSMLRSAALFVFDLETSSDAVRLFRHRSVARVYTLPAFVDALMGPLAFLAFVMVVVWLVWQYRSHGNLWAVGADGLRFTPGWAVGWWFVPVAGLVMPYMVMKELWSASGAASDGGGPGWLRTWWIASATALTLTVASVLLELHAGFTGRLYLSARLHWWAAARAAGAVAASSEILAGYLAIGVIRRIDHAEKEARDKSLAAWATPDAVPRPDLGSSGG